MFIYYYYVNGVGTLYGPHSTRLPSYRYHDVCTHTGVHAGKNVGVRSYTLLLGISPLCTQKLVCRTFRPKSDLLFLLTAGRGRNVARNTNYKSGYIMYTRAHVAATYRSRRQKFVGA